MTIIITSFQCYSFDQCIHMAIQKHILNWTELLSLFSNIVCCKIKWKHQHMNIFTLAQNNLSYNLLINWLLIQSLKPPQHYLVHQRQIWQYIKALTGSKLCYAIPKTLKILPHINNGQIHSHSYWPEQFVIWVDFRVSNMLTCKRILWNMANALLVKQSLVTNLLIMLLNNTKQNPAGQEGSWNFSSINRKAVN